MARIKMQAIPSFHVKFSKKNYFDSTIKNEQYILSKEYFIANHDEKNAFYLNAANTHWHWRVATEIGLIKFHLPTRGPYVHFFQVSIH